MKPLVSILIPAYNAEAWIADTLRSALDQTWNRREIIVVDDGSRDRTGAIARQFVSRELQVVTQENQGGAAARNKAYSLCQGDYIQWMDADDLLGPDKVARQMARAEELADRRVLISGAWAYFFQRPTKARFAPSPLWEDLTPTEWLRRKMTGGYHMQTATWLVSRELTEAAGAWNPRLLVDDDGEYFCRVLLASCKTSFVPEARVYYRQSGSSQVSFLGVAPQKLNALWESMRLHVQYLLSLEDSPATRAACLKYLHLWAVFFYPDRMDLVGQTEQLAVSLGGRLAPPELSWKYAWIQKIFGWKAARQAGVNYNLGKQVLLQAWDRLMLRWEKYPPGSSLTAEKK